MDLLPKIEATAKRVLGHRWVIRSLILSAFGCCLWFWYKPAEPGIAIAVLGGMAAVVTFAEMTSKQKLLATIAIFALMGIEIRDIRKDRVESDRQAHEQRENDQQSFSAIGVGIKTAIQNSQDQFTKTMTELKTTLNAINQTIENTRPKAFLEFRSIDMILPSQFTSRGGIVRFNLAYTNAGADAARGVSWLARAYPGKLDDKDTQQSLLDKFNKEWDGDIRNKRNLVITPNEPALDSFSSEEFTPRDAVDIQNRATTIYVIYRFAWKDQTGSWRNDYCSGYQDIIRSILGHPCLMQMPRRYPDGPNKQAKGQLKP